MMKKREDKSFRWCLIFSLFMHATAFLAVRSPYEYRKISYYSSLPVDLINVPVPEEEKKEVEKKEEKKKEDKVSIKQKTRKNESKEEKKPAPPILQEPAKPRPVSSPNIDLKNFAFPWYLALIEQRVRQNWQMPSGLEDLIGKKAVVYFRIFRKGEVQEARLETPSGDSLLDQSGLRAVKESSPFPSLPEEFKEEYLSVHFYFEIQ